MVEQVAYLVDTDMLIDVAKNNPAALDYVESLAGAWSVAVLTAMEPIVGARDRQEVEKIDQFLAALPTAPLVPPVGNRAYALLKQYSRSHGLRIFDALIAATAIENELTLATRNAKHFRMIAGLKLEVPRY